MDIVKTGGICSKYCLSGKVEKEEEEDDNDPFGEEVGNLRLELARIGIGNEYFELLQKREFTNF